MIHYFFHQNFCGKQVSCVFVQYHLKGGVNSVIIYGVFFLQRVMFSHGWSMVLRNKKVHLSALP